MPFLPRRPKWRDLAELDQFEDFHLQALDIVVVVVSKLARFNANDVQDIDAMIAQGLVPHSALIERFRAAVESYEMDARADRGRRLGMTGRADQLLLHDFDGHL